MIIVFREEHDGGINGRCKSVEEEFVMDTTIHVRSIRRMKKVIKRVQVCICVMW